MLTKTKIYRSSLHMSGMEQQFVDAAFATNWVSSVSANIEGFENNMQHYLANPTYAIALNSGTSAIDIALQLLHVHRGDELRCQIFTFCATANPMEYQGLTESDLERIFKIISKTPSL